MRAARVALVALKHALAHLARRLSVGDPGPTRLRRLLEELGGTYIKFGQLLALQPDVLPRAYCNALFDLLDRVPPFDYAHVERTFVEDLGAPPERLFERFERVPLAAASIGQVHRAVLDGRALAVKVRRPEAEREFEADLRLLGRVAGAIRALGLERLDWVARMIEELTTWTREELDYRHEARFMAALGFHARDNPREAVPEVFDTLTTRRILTAGFLDGPTVLDYIRALERGGDPELERRLQAARFDPECFARHIVRNFVRDAFRHGLFHADLHPANLLILPDSVVGYVDFGITGALSRHSRRNIVALTLALTRADPEAMRDHFLRLATLKPWSDVPAFERGLRELVTKWYEGRGGARRLRASFTTVMLDMLRLARRTSVWPTPDGIRYMRSVVTADGLIARFAPRLDVGRYLQEVCVEHLERDVWREWVSPENLADWTAAGARLLARAPETLSALLAREDRPPRGPCAASRWRAAGQWALAVLAFALLAAAPGGRPAPGWNTATAALFLALAALAGLARAVRRRA